MVKVLHLLITRGGDDDFVLSVNLEAVAKFFCAPGQASTVRVLINSAGRNAFGGLWGSIDGAHTRRSDRIAVYCTAPLCTFAKL
jgi:hypothetical protein